MNGPLLITGITGFISGALARHFSEKGFQVVGVTRGLTKGRDFPIRRCSYLPRDIATLVDELRPRVIFHGAGTAAVGSSLQNPVADFSGSVTLFHSLLEGVRRSRHRPLIVYPSSASVYGNPVSLPIAETARLSPISPYGYHKQICELLAEEYHACFKMPALVIRVFSLFGPGQRRLLIWELFNQFQKKKKVIIAGTGKESRDYLFIEDFAAYLLDALKAVKESFMVLNIASGTSVTVKEITRKVRNLMGSKKPIVFRGAHRPGDPNEWRADISKLECLIGKVNCSFDLKLEQSIQHWRKAY